MIRLVCLVWLICFKKYLLEKTIHELFPGYLSGYEGAVNISDNFDELMHILISGIRNIGMKAALNQNSNQNVKFQIISVFRIFFIKMFFYSILQAAGKCGKSVTGKKNVQNGFLGTKGEKESFCTFFCIGKNKIRRGKLI